ncbi:hypothetical protein DRI50_11410, partial [candidate division KSB1 bacterium]
TKGISDLITIPGLINLDFADIVTVMSEAGDSLMGTSAVSGEGRAQRAAEQAISSPLLENISIAGARGLLVNITGGPDMSLHDVSEAASIIQSEAGPNANLILGAVIDNDVADEMRITVIATGLSAAPHRYHHPSLQRPQNDVTRIKGIDRREIPAIDRMDEISQNWENTNAPQFGFGSTVTSNYASHPQPQTESKPQSLQQPAAKKEVDVIDSLEKLEPSDVRPADFDLNVRKKEDYEVPAVRRRRWKMLG